MKTVKKSFKYSTYKEEKGSDTIDLKATKKGLKTTLSNSIFCNRNHDQTHIDADGYEITVGYRVDKIHNPVEFIIKNSFKKDKNDKVQKLLSINN